MLSPSEQVATSDLSSPEAPSGVLSLHGGPWNQRTARAAAHEFSNLMTVILGYTQILELELASDPAARARLREISAAASRATALIEAMRNQAG